MPNKLEIPRSWLAQTLTNDASKVPSGAAIVAAFGGSTSAIGLQSTTPGTPQTGNFNLQGTGLISATYGSELAPSLVDANWTVGAGWQSPVAGGILYHNAAGTGTAAPTVSLAPTARTTYKVVITTGNQLSGGTFRWYFGGVKGTELSAASTTYTEYITAVNTNNLIFVPSVTSMLGKIISVSTAAQTSTNSLGVGTTLSVDSTATFNSHIYTSNGSIIYKDGQPYIHTWSVPGTYGNNFFAGKGAGNPAGMTGGDISYASNNVGIGRGVLGVLTTGYKNAMGGDNAGANAQTANWCSYWGAGAGGANVGAQDETGVGAGALALSLGNGTLGQNTATGVFSLGKLVSGQFNTANGWFSGDGHDEVSVNERSITDAYMLFLGARATRDPCVLNTTTLTNSNAVGTLSKVWASYMTALGYPGTTATHVWGNATVVDANTLGSESLANPNLTSGTSWAATNDCALASDKATWTYSAGTASTLTQATGDMSVPLVANCWYKFIYTTSDVTGTPNATIPATVADVAKYLVLVNGAQTLYFKTAATATDFVITSTLTAGQAFSLDTFSLKKLGGSIDTTSYKVNGTEGASGSYTTADAKTVTVVKGLITAIAP